MTILKIKKHPIYHWLYAFTDGRVYSTKTHKFVGSYNKKTGYTQVGIGNHRNIGVHILVADCFIQKPETTKLLEVNHKNQNRSDNRVENLEWVTHYQNMNYTPTKESISKTLKITLNLPKNKLKNISSQTLRMKIIQCIETGKIFESIHDAARKMNLGQGNLTTHLNHPEKLHSIKGYHFKFIEN